MTSPENQEPRDFCQWFITTYLFMTKRDIMHAIPERFHDLLKDETRAFLYLATLMEDGTPQLTPVWFNYDGKFILINSARGRVKDVNMRARPTVACLIVDPADPYRYIQIRGRVAAITEEGADEHINDLKYKYHGRRGYPIGDDTRVIYRIQIENVSTAD